MSNRTEKFFGYSGDYYLSIGDFDAFFGKYPIFGEKMGVAAGVAPKGLGPQDPTKKLAYWVNLLGQQLTRKLIFQNFGPEPPLKKYKKLLKIF